MISQISCFSFVKIVMFPEYFTLLRRYLCSLFYNCWGVPSFSYVIRWWVWIFVPNCFFSLLSESLQLCLWFVGGSPMVSRCLGRLLIIQRFSTVFYIFMISHDFQLFTRYHMVGLALRVSNCIVSLFFGLFCFSCIFGRFQTVSRYYRFRLEI